VEASDRKNNCCYGKEKKILKVNFMSFSFSFSTQTIFSSSLISFKPYFLTHKEKGNFSLVFTVVHDPSSELSSENKVKKSCLEGVG
jgi:hypothetical protein